jgi:hypothetical protein
MTLAGRMAGSWSETAGEVVFRGGGRSEKIAIHFLSKPVHRDSHHPCMSLIA